MHAAGGARSSRRATGPREHRQPTHQQEIRHDLLIAALAIASVAIGAYQLTHERTTGEIGPLDWIDLAIAVFFIVDFAWHAWREGWRGYLRSHWWELPALLPVTPILVSSLQGFALVRGVRLVRVARVLRLARLLGAASRTRAVARYALRVAHRARVPTLLGAGALVVALGTLVSWLVESDANPRLASPGDALWWSINMFTNVAYVDFQPATIGGRAIAAALELSGIAFIGLFTASLASAIVKEPSPHEQERLDEPE